MKRADVAVVGAGAAGLMAAVQAARAPGKPQVVALDGAGRLGAKILIAGGGRCNVTHDRVRAADYAGSSRPAIRKVLGRFDVEATIAFFRDLGVELKREATGKLFPTTNRARTVLDALLLAARDAHVDLRHPWRVASITKQESGFQLVAEDGARLLAGRVVIATGGRSVAQTGSDGHGYAMAQAMGHTLTPHVLPALVPLTLPADHALTRLRGLSTPVRLSVRQGGRERVSFEGALLLTHFGVSGPAVLDISRYYLHACQEHPDAELVVSWLPDVEAPDLDLRLRALGRAPVLGVLTPPLPRRLAEALVREADIDVETTGDHLPRDARRRLVEVATAQRLPVEGARGWAYAEVTAGGVPLREVDLATHGFTPDTGPLPVRRDPRRRRAHRRLQLPVGVGERDGGGSRGCGRHRNLSVRGERLSPPEGPRSTDPRPPGSLDSPTTAR